MNNGNSSWYNVKDKMNETMAIEGAGLPTDNLPKGLIIDGCDVYKGQVVVGEWCDMELVGLVNDKKCNKQPCQKATITEDRNSEHTMQDYEYCFYSDHHYRDGCGIRMWMLMIIGMIKMEGKFRIVIDLFSSNDNYGDEDEERGAIAMPTPKPPQTMARMSMTTMSILLILSIMSHCTHT